MSGTLRVQGDLPGTCAPFPRPLPGLNHENIRDLFLPLGVHCSRLHVMSRILTIIKPHLPAWIPSSAICFISLECVFGLSGTFWKIVGCRCFLLAIVTPLWHVPYPTWWPNGLYNREMLVLSFLSLTIMYSWCFWLLVERDWEDCFSCEIKGMGKTCAEFKFASTVPVPNWIGCVQLTITVPEKVTHVMCRCLTHSTPTD